MSSINPYAFIGSLHSIGSIGSVSRTSPLQFPTYANPYGNRNDSLNALQQLFGIGKAYNQTLKTAAAGVANVVKSAQELQSAARKLLQKDQSAFQARTAESSDGKTASATAASGATVRTYEVKVDAVAKNQINSGYGLSKSEPSAVSAGLNEFNITVGDKTTKVSVNLANGDTNDQALAKIRDAINAAKAGVTATIVTDKETGLRRLELKSDKTGTDHAFEVEDVTGNAVAATGIHNVSQLAANARYSVIGGETTESQSNTVELERGKVTATLHAASEEAVNIAVKPDADKIVSQVQDLVAGYNALIGKVKEAGGTLNPSVRRSLEEAVGSLAEAHIGIERKSDGTLRLDEERLKQSLDTHFSLVERTIGSKYGLADRLSSAAQRLGEVPTGSLLSRQTFQAQQLSLYQSSMQMGMFGSPSGLLVNLLF
jgi:flagellar capping protein FliD